MIAIIDYGAGNIRSVEKALVHIGCRVTVTRDPQTLLAADAAVLPGVGSFGDAMQELRARGLEAPIRAFIASGRPFLGICLGLLRGKIVRIPAGEGLKIPHMGWNSLDIRRPRGLFARIPAEPYVYFVHSYYLKAEEDIVTATASYGVTIDAAVQKDNLLACQFHPEKSGAVGIELLRNFAAMAGEGGRD